MSNNIDEIIDRLIKGGRGSGKRGHKSPLAPVSNIKREFDPEKKKKILSSDKRAAKKEVKDHTPEELQSKIDSHKELSESEHLSPASRESYAAKHKALVSHQKKQMKNAPAAPEKKVEGIASRPGPFGNINKGGPGSGKKGHMGVTPDRTQRERNRQKAGDALQTSKDAKRIIAELDLGKEDLKEIRDYASAEGISPSQFIVNNKDHIKTNLKKGGPGSGRKGHKSEDDGFDTSHHEMMHGHMTEDLEDEDHDNEEDAKEFLVNNFRNKIDNNDWDEYSQVSHAGMEDLAGQAAKKHIGMKKSLIMNKSLETLFYMQQLANQGRIKPKQKRNMKKSLKDRILEKKQGVPKGVDPAKHERCVLDVKADGQDKSSAYAICNASMNKAEEALEKFLAGAALKTGARVVQNLVKPAGGGDGSGADKPVGGYDGASVAAGGGTGKQDKGPGKKIKKSIEQRLDEMYKGGIGSGRKGHHSIGRDYGDNEHDSVFEDSRYDSTQEREIFMDKMHDAIKREEDRADQRIKEKESTAKRGMSRKPKKEAPKKTLLQKLTQKIIDAI